MGGSSAAGSQGGGDSLAISDADNFGSDASSSLAWLAQNPVYLTYVQQIGNAVQQYAPAASTAATGSYSELKCCYPDDVGVSCNDSERKEKNLQAEHQCVVVGDYCAASGMFGCTDIKQTSCCFSSVLARIIQEQGRPQLNTFPGGWGVPKSPLCRGFTPTEFQALDFSKIDFTEYINTIQAQVQTVTPMLTSYMSGVGTDTTTAIQNIPVPGPPAAQGN